MKLTDNLIKQVLVKMVLREDIDPEKLVKFVDKIGRIDAEKLRDAINNNEELKDKVLQEVKNNLSLSPRMRTILVEKLKEFKETFNK